MRHIANTIHRELIAFVGKIAFVRCFLGLRRRVANATRERDEVCRKSGALFRKSDGRFCKSEEREG